MDKEKALAIAALTMISSWLGILAIPVFLLVLLNITDYLTGIAAAKYRGQKISSYSGFRGIVKKVCMWLLVGLGAVIDWLLEFTARQAGIVIPLGYTVACLVAVWLICNELLSILENIGDIGVTLPPFLMKLVSQMKSKMENSVDTAANSMGEKSDLKKKNSPK